eukprot:TRINITY_DN44060_c0_g1_i1.p2 TRINITY_DN44060_c0_g1~~TRINITY_DN44060_c0_g1_i1.p2  ORF type:complete len:103 (-),score=25.04 TRINITY_DN44060_c0_g1_i1:139-447(-)
MIRRPPRSTLSSSSAASDVYKRQIVCSSNTQSRVDTRGLSVGVALLQLTQQLCEREKAVETLLRRCAVLVGEQGEEPYMKGGLDAPDGMTCLLYTSPSPRDS